MLLLALAEYLCVNKYQLAYFPGAAPNQSQLGTFTTFQGSFIQTEISQNIANLRQSNYMSLIAVCLSIIGQ